MIEEDFEFVSQLLKKRSGLALTRDKIYLLEGRLLPVARSHGHEELTQLLKVLRQNPDAAIVAEVVDAMTTNESKFFRDQKPFNQLTQLIFPRVKPNVAGRKLRIWSAGCAGGQEPYSIAMSLLQPPILMQEGGYEIMATDISERMIQKATGGSYTQFEVQRGLPVELLIKYFTQTPDNRWQVNDHLRSNIRFQYHNLLEDNAGLGRFDIIFCRNVLFYFDEATKRTVLTKLASRLHPKGVLVLGSSETTIGISDKYHPLENENGLFELKQ